MEPCRAFDSPTQRHLSGVLVWCHQQAGIVHILGGKRFVIRLMNMPVNVRIKAEVIMKPTAVFWLTLMLRAQCDAAIVYPNAPEGGQEVVSENVGRVLRSDPHFLGGFHLEDLTIATPYQDYGVGLADLGAGKFLSVAKPGGWIYPLMHGTNAAGSAQLISDPKGGKAMVFNGLFQTAFSSETLEALRKAGEWPQVKTQDYEVRRLNLPGIHFVAVWFHAKSDDIIIPLPNTFGRWNAYQPYSESQMLQLLKPEADKVLGAPKLFR
jgi:hypothetical protein